jgi:hypothetical protein
VVDHTAPVLVVDMAEEPSQADISGDLEAAMVDLGLLQLQREEAFMEEEEEEELAVSSSV